MTKQSKEVQALAKKYGALLLPPKGYRPTKKKVSKKN